MDGGHAIAGHQTRNTVFVRGTIASVNEEGRGAKRKGVLRAALCVVARPLTR